MTRDWWAADGAGRVWLRYTGTVAMDGTDRRVITTGATCSLVRDGRVAWITSWIDLTFMLGAAPAEAASDTR